ncbi:hypothetical protein HPB48_003807 [Haemaphysalis longicornis]|uniref:Sema domain-containing protein n=1 Tax=Haemaphysalis longicornis TaxID=44386 RepID=A0A9J6GJI6_HAELO|nr:hypothetical protein HPB48_003807 [Haemaphysalis longicornis]
MHLPQELDLPAEQSSINKCKDNVEEHRVCDAADLTLVPEAEQVFIGDNNKTGGAAGRCPFYLHHDTTSLWLDDVPVPETSSVVGLSILDLPNEYAFYRTAAYDSSNRNEPLHDYLRTTTSEVTIALNHPHAVGAFSRGERVYFVFREEAVERRACGAKNVSGLARLCKNDIGRQDIYSHKRWTSFTKVRLQCNDKTEPVFPFDEILAAAKRVWGSGSKVFDVVSVGSGNPRSPCLSLDAPGTEAAKRRRIAEVLDELENDSSDSCWSSTSQSSSRSSRDDGDQLYAAAAVEAFVRKTVSTCSEEEVLAVGWGCQKPGKRSRDHGSTDSAICAFRWQGVEEAFNSSFAKRPSNAEYELDRPVPANELPSTRPGGDCPRDPTVHEFYPVLFLQSHPLLIDPAKPRHDRPFYARRGLEFKSLAVFVLTESWGSWVVCYVGTGEGFRGPFSERGHRVYASKHRKH